MRSVARFVASSHFLSFLFGGLLALVVVSVAALAQAPAAPAAPEISPVLKLFLPLVLPVVVPALSGAVIWAIVKGVSLAESFVDAHVGDQNLRNAIDHVLSAVQVGVQHVELNVRPLLTQDAGELLSTGKLSAAGQKRLEDAALASVKSDSGTMIAAVQDGLGLSEQALADFLRRKITDAVQHLPPSTPAPAKAA